MSDGVRLGVPLLDGDQEVALMAALVVLINHFEGGLCNDRLVTEEQLARVVNWAADRYGKP